MAVRSIAVAVTARPSWAKLQPVVAELRKRGYLVDLIACAYALLHHYGSVDELMKADGMPPTCRLHTAFDGTTHETAALTTSALTAALTHRFAHTKPDLVIVCADRHETLAVSIAASYLNIPLLHLQGGEHTGSIDDKVRWANTMLADGHAVSHGIAQDDLVDALASARRPTVYLRITGCPSIDVARLAKDDPPVTLDELGGTGAAIDLAQPFAIACVHPDTTEPHMTVAYWQAAMVIAEEQNLPTVAFWPGADAGSATAAKFLRSGGWFVGPVHFVRSLRPRRYLRLLSQAALTIGNSSSFVREGRFLNIPTRLLGPRQFGRWDERYLYGDGHASEKIVDLVAEMLA